MHEEMLTYGLKRGTKDTLLHINVVPNGLGCDCVCPHCKHDLIARNGGSKKTHHFAHASGADCGGARMTALHMLAQKILERDKKVMLPNYEGEYHQVSTEGVEFDEIRLEQTYTIQDKHFRPDCMGVKYDKHNNPHPLWIEIYVTHEVNSEKQNAIREAVNACIEIDLSDMLDTDYTEESIAQRLQNQKEDRTWISCPIYDKIENEKRAEAEREEAERKRLEDEEQERISKLDLQLSLEVKAWYRDKTSEQAETIIAKIKEKPYTDEPKVYDHLIPYGNFILYILHSPKNEDGLKVYYTLLRYYYNKVTTSDYQEIKRQIRYAQYDSKQITAEEKVKFEEWISLRIIYILELNRKKFSEVDIEGEYKNCIKKYISDSNIRSEVLMLVSVLYHHVVGSNAQNFGELTEEIIKEHPSIAKLYLTVIDNQDKYPNNYRLGERDMLMELREFVENNSTEADKVVKNIIEECYDFALVPPTKKDVGMTKKYDPYKSYNDSWNEFNKHFGLTDNVAQSVPF